MKKLVALFTTILLAGNFALAHATEKTATEHHRTEHHDNKKSDDTAPVNINQADASTLTEIKGIGPKKAQAIVSYREQHGPFKNIDDLQNVPGFGAKKVAKIKEENGDRIITG